MTSGQVALRRLARVTCYSATSRASESLVLVTDRLALVRRARANRDLAGLGRRQAAVRSRRRPARARAGTDRDRDTGRALVAGRAEVRRRARVEARVVSEVRLLGRDEVAEVRLHRGDVRLLLRVRELRDRDRGKNAEDHDDNQELEQRETLLGGAVHCSDSEGEGSAIGTAGLPGLSSVLSTFRTRRTIVGVVGH